MCRDQVDRGWINGRSLGTVHSTKKVLNKCRCPREVSVTLYLHE